MFERQWTIANDNAAPGVVTLDELSLPGGDDDLEISVWQSSTVAAPALVLEDTVPLNTAQSQVSGTGRIAALLCVPSNGGVAACRFSNDIRTLTVFFPAGVPANDFQYLTIRIRSVEND